MNNADSVLQSIIDECHEDHVGLWIVIREVRATLADDSKVLDTTLALIKRLLLEGDIVAGQFRRIGEKEWLFDEWDMPSDEITAKIGREWVALGHEPTGGDVVWFTAKTKGAA